MGCGGGMGRGRGGRGWETVSTRLTTTGTTSHCRRNHLRCSFDEDRSIPSPLDGCDEAEWLRTSGGIFSRQFDGRATTRTDRYASGSSSDSSPDSVSIVRECKGRGGVPVDVEASFACWTIEGEATGVLDLPNRLNPPNPLPMPERIPVLTAMKGFAGSSRFRLEGTASTTYSISFQLAGADVVGPGYVGSQAKRTWRVEV
jgi:hypothetical protein